MNDPDTPESDSSPAPKPERPIPPPASAEVAKRGGAGSGAKAAAERPAWAPPDGWRGLVNLFAGMLLLFGGYRLFVWLAEEGIKRGDYEEALFLLSALGKSAGRLGFWAFVIVAGAALWINGRKSAPPRVGALVKSTKPRGTRWRDLGCGTRMHWFIYVMLFIAVWTAAFYPWNFYWGHAHLADRAIIVALGVLCFRYPGVLPVFTMAVLVSYWQWRVPLGDPEGTNRKLLIDLLLTLNGALLVWRWKWFPRPAVVLALAGVVIIHYWIPGREKFGISENDFEWLLDNKALNMMVVSFTLGWNAFWDEAGVAQVYQAMSWAEVPLKFFVLVVELALIVSFWKRPVFLAFTAGRILLHVGILFFSGDTFWNWTLLQVGLLATFLWPSKGDKYIFGWRPMGAVVLFTLATAPSYDANPLGWFDSRLSERYDLVAVTEGGERLLIDPFFFAPYEFTFLQSKFHFLHEDTREGKILTRTYGAIHDEKAARDFRAVKTPEEARKMVRRHGKNYHDEDMAQQLEEFVRRWFENYETVAIVKDSPWVEFLEAVHPPPHALAFTGRVKGVEVDSKDGGRIDPDYPPVYEMRVFDPEKDLENIARVEVVFERLFFDGEVFHRMDREVVREFGIEEGN